MKNAFAIVLLLAAAPAWAQNKPTTQPAKANPDDMLKQLLSPSRPQVAPLNPEPDPPGTGTDAGKSRRAAARSGDLQNLVREGTIIHERVCRLTRTADNQAELTFESDGQSLKDPPMLILPNLNLAVMEKALLSNTKDLKFRVTGMVTEYGNRNYILLEKVVVGSDETIPPSARLQKKDDDRLGQ